MAGPVEMARLVSILAQRQNSVGLDGRARLSEQGQPSKSSSEFQTWLRQSCFEWALRRQEIPCPIEAGRIVVELPTGDRVERIGRLPGLIQRFVFPGGFLPSKTSYATRKSGSEDRRSGEFRRGLCVDVAGVAKAFPEKWPQVERLGFDAPFSRLWEYYLCYWEAGFRSGMIDVGLYSIQHRRA